jgi:hypothetical protein
VPARLTFRTSRTITIVLIVCLAISLLLVVAGADSRGLGATFAFIFLVGRDFLLGRTIVGDGGVRPGGSLRSIPWSDIENIDSQPRFRSPDNTLVTVTRRGRTRPVPLWGTSGADLAAIQAMRPGRTGKSGNPQKASR